MQRLFLRRNAFSQLHIFIWVFILVSGLAISSALEGARANPDPDLDASDALDRLIPALEALQADPANLEELRRRITSGGETTRSSDSSNPDQEILELEEALDRLEARQESLRQRLEAIETIKGLLDSEPPEKAEKPRPRSSAPPVARFEGLARVDFNRDIRPILADNCYACHGPDEKQRKAGLRLDLKKEALKPLGGDRFLVVPGKPEESELFYRVATHDPDDRMPPEKSGKTLSDKQVSLIGAWIKQGAVWQEHWAFLPPKRPSLPQLKNPDWPENEIDFFIQSRLASEGLAPSPEAERRTLIRRLALDLTGLSPTVEEVEEFLADDQPGAYERLVDRFLFSKHFGERMAQHWLDLARYADSDGYHIDYEKSIWQYRDWVIDAFNENKPFDVFTIEQLAGDLLPDPTLDQLIATAFNRNGMTSTEGGADPKEYLTKYVIDRVNTTATVWMGLTMGCAECHDHKYDPITQKEFYRFYDFFNRLEESGLDKDPCPPYIRVPPPGAEEKLATLRSRIEDQQSKVDELVHRRDEKLDALQAEWEVEAAQRYDRVWTPLEVTEASSENGLNLEVLSDGSIQALGSASATDSYVVRVETDLEGVRAIKLEAIPNLDDGGEGPGLSSNGNFVLSGIDGSMAPVEAKWNESPLIFNRAVADFEQNDWPVEGVLDDDPETGWGILPQVQEVHFTVFDLESPIGHPNGTVLTFHLHFHSVNPEHLLGRFRLSATTQKDPIYGHWSALGPFPASTAGEAFTRDFGPEHEIDLTKTYQDGELSWAQHPEWIDGQIHHLKGEVAATYLYRTIYSPTHRVGVFSFGSNDGIQAWLNGEKILERDVARGAAPDQDEVRVELRPGDNQLLLKINNHGGGFSFYFSSTPKLDGEEGIIAKAFRLSPDLRTSEQGDLIKRKFRLARDPKTRAVDDQIAKLQAEFDQIEEDIPTIRIMRDMEEKRPTYILVRGDYRNPGEEVTAGAPAFLPALQKKEGAPDRLDLARWLVNPDHPLTSRVTVNRFWQMFFGTGLVKTSEDFGSQGEWPSHPELLDWLAVDFIESGWDVKALLRKIVTSATYRQSSVVTPELLKKDPRNRLLARGPRFRLPAEMVRDNALAIAGLLDRADPIGGPSVRPYQPSGLWQEKAIGSGESQRYVQDQGEAIYRRSLYVFWKRSVPYPAMMVFDAPSRETCTCRREVTNTPLQAFVTLNETTFVEAARHFAEKIMREGGESPEERVRFGFSRALSRPPKEKELDVLLKIQEDILEQYRANRELAVEYTSIGDSGSPTDLDSALFASWTAVASVILNLDETVTKE